MFYQCKMCGGTLDIKNNDSVGVCEYCGTKQTLPRLDNDKKANLYDRAAHFRQLNDYDKAMSLYEQVLAEDKTDAEAYWSIVLCRYGIEYVEDPSTHKRIPTVNRAQYTSIFNDSDYKSALQYADPFQSEIYEQEAKAIDDIQKGILKISKNEKPFDIFICYKESDDNGRRTIDSVLAYDVYKELVGAGYKVFFSRITLEDKIGTAYEPYIFAALNSAPIMLVIGTKPEHFNAVWVKNEWSRFLGMIKSGAKKTLIPMYKDMNPYNLPQEFAHLQAQDMNNLGFMQDLLRGIKKIVSNDKNNTVASKKNESNDKNEEIKKLLARADFAMDNKQWNEADRFFEDILKIDPMYALAYVGKLMAELQVSEIDGLKACDFDVDNNGNFKNALRCADGELKQQLILIKSTINNLKHLKAERIKKQTRIMAITAIGLAILVLVIFIIFKNMNAPKTAYEEDITNDEIIAEDDLKPDESTDDSTSDSINVNNDFEIHFTKLELCTDTDGNPAALLYFSFTNRTNKLLSMSEVYPITVKQNGIQCETFASLNEYPEEFYNKDTQISDGITLDCCYVVALYDEVTPLSITIHDNYETYADIDTVEMPLK